MKYFRMSYEEVVFRRSYINIMLLNKSIPSFDFDKDKEDEYDTEDDEYTAALKKMKKQERGKRKPKPKEKHTTPKTQHANDFFSQFM